MVGKLPPQDFSAYKGVGFSIYVDETELPCKSYSWLACTQTQIYKVYRVCSTKSNIWSAPERSNYFKRLFKFFRTHFFHSFMVKPRADWTETRFDAHWLVRLHRCQMRMRSLLAFSVSSRTGISTLFIRPCTKSTNGSDLSGYKMCKDENLYVFKFLYTFNNVLMLEINVE